MMSDIEKEAGTLILKEYSEFFKKQYQEFIIHSDNHTWEDNRNFHPIQTLFEPIEHLPIIDLVFSDNTLMTKILGVFSTLCVEVIKLRKEATERHFPYLALHDDYKNVNIASQIDAICNLNAFVIRCEETLRNLCAQVFALYGDVNIKLAGIQLHYIINHIGELFTLLVLLELIICNSTLSANWSNYCKNIKMLGHTHAENLVEEKFAALMGAIENITSKIMSDNIVQNAFTALSSLRKNLVEKSCSEIATEFTQYVKIAISNLEKLIQDKQNINNMRKCIKINAIYVLNSYLFGTNDKKVFRALVDLNTKAHSIPVVGIILWFPEQFLQRYLPSLGSLMSKVPQTMFKARHNYINNKKASLNRDEVHLQNLCTHWILTVDKMFCTKHMQLNAAEMNIHTKTILNGLDILSHTNYSVLTLINLHSSLGLPLSKTVLMSVFRIIEILKGLKNAVITNYDSIISSINMIIQHMIFQASSLLLEVKKSFISDKNFDNQRLDELTCIFVAERALKGPVTSERLVTTNVALSLLPDAAYPDGSYARLGMLFENIQSLINFMTCVNTLCDVSWLYWHQNIVTVYLDQNFTHRLDGIRLKYLFSALEDCALMLHKIDNECNCNKSEEFLDQMKLNIENAILNTTSQQIETNLRLHIHSHLQLDTVNPFTLDMLKKSLLVIDKFKLLRVYMSVIPSAEHYLSTMYYNLTTVVLSDWKTYGEMRQMARFKFGLKTIEDNLPTQTLEQGLDVLEIMRNIHIFVSKYLYNLNNQIFIEKSSNNKHLNSINIKHIANSIRTHGSGIMNTTVNFTYQFLRKKFFTFSQFMYDEHIKSRLIKDLRNFRENSATNGNMYSYKNADKFNKGIRNLGLAEDGQSYLDLFRDLISQIGNAMGYVRMIRSGGRHSCADATVFLPNLDQNKSFKELCEDSGLNITAIEAAENLDNNINNLMSNFTQGTEYFKLLVDVFAPVFRNPKNVHLKNFFIIVPPLTLNFIEHIILAKDKMTKKNKVGAAFSDDGFAMGIAYILRLLDQDSHFESLHWFQSVWKHINNEKSIVEEQKLKGSMQLQQALALTEKKLKILEEEFQLLYYSLTSARIFFR